MAAGEPGVYLIRATYTCPRERERANPNASDWRAARLQTPPVRIEVSR